MKIALSWLREWVDLPESADEIRLLLDDLGLVVEGVEHVGEGLSDIVVARVDAIRPIEGADKVRAITVDAGSGPVEIVCGAWNFVEGNRVPLAPVGAVLPGGFEIALRKMRGVTSNGMLCSAKELRLADDHAGLMILDDLTDAAPGVALMNALGIVEDVIFDLSVEGNRPDAWSVSGVARDLATRLERPVRLPLLAVPNSTTTTDSRAKAVIDAPDLCGRLTVAFVRGVRVGPSPLWMRQRLESAGMRAISNIVDASNLTMLELGQPNHAYDAATVSGGEIRVRQARSGEVLRTLDGVDRSLAVPGRGLGDTGIDCVIVDGADTLLGLAGIMGGLDSEISDTTTEILIEAAHFDPMTIARSSKRHGLRSEASNRFERGVDVELAPRALGRFVALLRETCPDLEWFSSPVVADGRIAAIPTIELRDGDVERALGIALDSDTIGRLLGGIGFEVSVNGSGLTVVPPTSRPDIRSGAMGRADVVEEIARLYSYRRLPRRTPSWPQPGALSARQQLRRRLRDSAVALGGDEAWTASLVSEAHVARTHPDAEMIRITNPLASDESVLRTSLISGLVDAWARNAERGLAETSLFEIGNVFTHPNSGAPRTTRGGVGGTVSLALPQEREHFTMVLGRAGEDATTAVALAMALLDRMGCSDVVVRSHEVHPGVHPTRVGALTDRASGAVLGFVGEVDPRIVASSLDLVAPRRLGLVELYLDVLVDPSQATRRDRVATIPSRFPSASLDLAFVTPDGVHAADVALALRSHEFVESAELFDVYRGDSLPVGTRSLAYAVRLSAADHTLAEVEIATAREALITRAAALGAQLR